MNEVIFDEAEENVVRINRPITVKQKSPYGTITKLALSTGLVKTPQGASILLASVAVILLVASGMFYIISTKPTYPPATQEQIYADLHRQ